MNINYLLKTVLIIFFAFNGENISGQDKVNIEYSRLNALSRKHNRNPDSLLFYSQKLLDFSNKNNLIYGQKAAYKSLGFVYSRLKNYEKSTMYYHKALSIAKKSNDDRFKYIIYNDLSIIHRSTKYYDSAFYYTKLLISHHKLINDNTSLSVDYMNAGIIFFQKSSLDSAETYFLKSIKGFRQDENLMFVSTSLSLLGEVYYQKKEYKKALKTVESSQEISKKLNLKRNYSRNYSLFSRTYKSLGDVKNSEKYYTLSISNNNSNKNAGFAINEKLAKSRANNNEHIAKMFSNENELYKSKLFLIVFVALLLLIISYSLYRRNKTSLNEVGLLQEKLDKLLAENVEEVVNLIHLKSKAVIDLNKLIYIKSDKHYLEFYIEGKNNPEIDRNSLKKIVHTLPSTTFVRIHNSFIVNIKYIKIINSTKLMLTNGKWINLSRTYKQDLKDTLNKE